MLGFLLDGGTGRLMRPRTSVKAGDSVARALSAMGREREVRLVQSD